MSECPEACFPNRSQKIFLLTYHNVFVNENLEIENSEMARTPG
jgi:hypothetical protein